MKKSIIIFLVLLSISMFSNTVSFFKEYFLNYFQSNDKFSTTFAKKKTKNYENLNFSTYFDYPYDGTYSINLNSGIKINLFDYQQYLKKEIFNYEKNISLANIEARKMNYIFNYFLDYLEYLKTKNINEELKRVLNFINKNNLLNKNKIFYVRLKNEILENEYYCKKIKREKYNNIKNLFGYHILKDSFIKNSSNLNYIKKNIINNPDYSYNKNNEEIIKLKNNKEDFSVYFDLNYNYNNSWDSENTFNKNFSCSLNFEKSFEIFGISLKNHISIYPNKISANIFFIDYANKFLLNSNKLNNVLNEKIKDYYSYFQRLNILLTKLKNYNEVINIQELNTIKNFSEYIKLINEYYSTYSEIYRIYLGILMLGNSDFILDNLK
ncbi:hypothetical protein OSSY52_11130 [Tepiditoga spiralis]|uniref:Uncharacterized protein n=1 Tax=Tepiditoga spiralis TaxID=2108365 RepID=A0A7G1G191_9BACT|nr:hypothetical protein [Tepiditoga spiralis]BBE29900.1 hypothetical protein OSSY52_00410 [Tepiditoga spiralis]BBE30972.1 hypothetical protein OSSY52_11130 [Tepiditoga spiralis]